MFRNEIIHTKIATASPKSNGQVERFNRIITSLAKLISTEPSVDWDVVLPNAEFALNNTLCRKHRYNCVNVIIEELRDVAHSNIVKTQYLLLAKNCCRMTDM